jgi:hypothetical protein
MPSAQVQHPWNALYQPEVHHSGQFLTNPMPNCSNSNWVLVGKKYLKIYSFLNYVFSDFSSPSQPDSVQTSNEYRNLLLSLSDNRCDHILWIRELRKLNWRGDGDFSFTLDKGGLPTLKVN